MLLVLVRAVSTFALPECAGWRLALGDVHGQRRSIRSRRRHHVRCCLEGNDVQRPSYVGQRHLDAAYNSVVAGALQTVGAANVRRETPASFAYSHIAHAASVQARLLPCIGECGIAIQLTSSYGVCVRLYAVRSVGPSH